MYTKEKTPVKVDGLLQIGPFFYSLYMVIVHTGKDASSGHYYAIGCRSEQTQNGGPWFLMDDSQVKPTDLSLLSGYAQDKPDDNPYVLFYRCQQAPATSPLRLPRALVDEICREEAEKQIVE